MDILIRRLPESVVAETRATNPNPRHCTGIKDPIARQKIFLKKVDYFGVLKES